MLTGAAIGAGLVLLWWGILQLTPDLPVSLVGLSCRSGGDLGCALGEAVISFVLTMALVIGSSVLIAWLVAWRVGLRPAWAMALLGPVFGWLLAWLSEPVAETLFGQSALRLLPPVALGFGVAGLLTAQSGA